MSSGVQSGRVAFDTYLEGFVLSYRIVFGVLVALRPILRVKEGTKSKFIVDWLGSWANERCD
jgi:hypothetical protein